MTGTEESAGVGKVYTLLGPDRRPYSSESPGLLGGHRGSKIYGRLDCPAAARAIARGGYVKHRVFFADESTAIAAGFRPCGTCLPEKYRAWKASKEPRRMIGLASSRRADSVMVGRRDDPHSAGAAQAFATARTDRGGFALDSVRWSADAASSLRHARHQTGATPDGATRCITGECRTLNSLQEQA